MDNKKIRLGGKEAQDHMEKKYSAAGMDGGDGLERVAMDSFAEQFQFEGVGYGSEYQNAGGIVDVVKTCGVRPLFNEAKKKAYDECKKKVQDFGFEKRDVKLDIKKEKGEEKSGENTMEMINAANAGGGGMSTGAIIGISVGVLAVVGMTLFFVFRKK